MSRNPSHHPDHYHGSNWRERHSSSRILSGLMAGVLAVGLAGYYFAAEMRKNVETIPEPEALRMVREEGAAENRAAPAAEPETLSEQESESEPYYYPVGDFLTTPAREEYRDEDMELFIPKMELECAVYGASDEETLLAGPGLFELAQLPGPMDQNANVSIAGNRDVGGSEFFLIDQLGEGDRIYLRYEDVLYTYEYFDTFVTPHQEYWELLRVQEYPCVTLQSCTPPGESRETQDRIFVIAKLTDVQEGAGFPAEDALAQQGEAAAEL